MDGLTEARLWIQPSPQRDTSNAIVRQHPSSIKAVSLIDPSHVSLNRSCEQCGIAEDHCALNGSMWWTHRCVGDDPRLSQATRSLRLDYSPDITEREFCSMSATLAKRAIDHVNGELAAAAATEH